MAVSRHGGEAGDSMFLHEIVNLAALHVRAAVVSSRESSKTFPGPGLCYSRWQILRIGPHVQCGCGVSPNLPGGLGLAQAIQKPCFLFRPENGLSWPIFGK